MLSFSLNLPTGGTPNLTSPGLQLGVVHSTETRAISCGFQRKLQGLLLEQFKMKIKSTRDPMALIYGNRGGFHPFSQGRLEGSCCRTLVWMVWVVWSVWMSTLLQSCKQPLSIVHCLLWVTHVSFKRGIILVPQNFSFTPKSRMEYVCNLRLTKNIVTWWQSQQEEVPLACLSLETPKASADAERIIWSYSLTGLEFSYFWLYIL